MDARVSDPVIVCVKCPKSDTEKRRHIAPNSVTDRQPLLQAVPRKEGVMSKSNTGTSGGGKGTAPHGGHGGNGGGKGGGGRGPGNAGGWPSGIPGMPSGGGRSNNPPGGGKR